jgi:serine/threonine-protein kinase RsbW
MSSFETTGEPDKLGAVTEFVRQAARSVAFADEDLLAVDLIVEEIFLNIALHGYKGRSPGPVAIDCASPGAGVLTIQFRDWAGQFNPLATDPPALDVPLSQRRVGGLGLVVVKRMAESVSYRRVEHRNELSVRIVSARQ